MANCNGFHQSAAGASSANGPPPAGGVAAAAGGPRKPKNQINSGHNLNNLIYLMYARHNFLFCAAIIEQCIKTGCDLEYPYYVKGLIARQEGKLAEAIKHFQRAVELNSKNTECYREIAKTLYIMGRFKQSLEIFVRTETLLQTSDCESQFYIAKLLTKNVSHGTLRRHDAKEYFLKAIQRGKHWESMNELAEIYVREGDLRKSIELLDNSLQVNADDVNVLTRIGILHLMVGETQTAFTRLLDALAIDGNSPKLLLALGGILQARGDADGALNKYKSIDNLEEQGAEIWSNLGLCFYRNQKLIAAISCLRKSIWISPLNFNGLFNLGYVFIKAKLYMSAFHIFATVINLKPNHAESYMLLGVCLAELDDKKNAMAALEKAVGLPDAAKHPLIYLNAAIYCYQNKVYDRSVENVNRYVVLVDKDNGQQLSSATKNHLKVARKLMGLLKLITGGEGSSSGGGNANIITNDYSADNSVIAPSVGQMLNNDEDDDGVNYEDRVEGEEVGNDDEAGKIDKISPTSATTRPDSVLDEWTENVGGPGPSLTASSSAHQVQGDDDDDSNEDVGLTNRAGTGPATTKEKEQQRRNEGRRSADYDFMTVVADVEHKFE